MLSTFFVENLVANLLHQSRHVEIDAAGSQQVRWFVRVLNKWNVEKSPDCSAEGGLLVLGDAQVSVV